jgi:hypothetical protein
MAKTQTLRIQAQVLKADIDALRALKAISDYKPVNPAYTIQAVAAKHDAMQAALEAESDAQDALAARRDAAVAAQWEYHNTVLGAKNQVVAQYGEDSDQLASLGLKKKSERKAPVRAAKPAAAKPS